MRQTQLNPRLRPSSHVYSAGLPQQWQHSALEFPGIPQPDHRLTACTSTHKPWTCVCWTLPCPSVPQAGSLLLIKSKLSHSRLSVCVNKRPTYRGFGFISCVLKCLGRKSHLSRSAQGGRQSYSLSFMSVLKEITKRLTLWQGVFSMQKGFWSLN